MTLTWMVRLDRALTMLAVSGLLATVVCDLITAPAPRAGCHQEDPDILGLLSSGFYLFCRFAVRLIGRMLRAINKTCERLLASWTQSPPANCTLLMDDLDYRLAEMKPRP